MNWYKKSQSSSFNYHTMHKPDDIVWIFSQNGNLIVDYPKGENSKLTHNKSFGRDKNKFFFKGRYNPGSGLAYVVAHPEFLSTNQDYVKKQMENALYNEFGPNTKIKYF